jgi:hypothetical protein
MTRQRLVTAGALLSLVLAALLIAFAVDVRRWERSLETQDVRFLGAPTAVRFSPPPSIIPFDGTERALGATDDLAFRRQLQGFARVRPGVSFNEPLLALRAETQVGLAELAHSDPDPRRRARAANMIGVIALNESLAPRDADALASLITGAIGSFRNAVEIDPANSDAKTNLELALRIAKAVSLGGDAPSGGRNTGESAGLGQPGSGY